MTIPYRRRMAILASSVTGRLPVVKAGGAEAPAEGRGGVARRPAGDPPLYARALRLRRIHPGGLLCFLYFEGAIALAVLLTLAELVPWPAIPLLPVTVAAIIKINDMTTGDGPSTPGSSKLIQAGGGSPTPGRPAIGPVVPRSPYPPRMAYALEAVPARATLYGTPVRLDPDAVGKPPRGTLAPSAVYRSSAALSGQPAIEGPVPSARLEQEPYRVAGRVETLRRGAPPGGVYYSTPH